MDIYFYNDIVQKVEIIPTEPITYEKSHKEIFYMLGLGETYYEYSVDEHEYIYKHDRSSDGGIKILSIENQYTEGYRPKVTKSVKEILILYRLDSL